MILNIKRNCSATWNLHWDSERNPDAAAIYCQPPCHTWSCYTFSLALFPNNHRAKTKRNVETMPAALYTARPMNTMFCTGPTWAGSDVWRSWTSSWSDWLTAPFVWSAWLSRHHLDMGCPCGCEATPSSSPQPGWVDRRKRNGFKKQK